jgi:ferredoxin
MELDKAVTCVDVVPNAQEECAKKGAEECPVEAIKIS